MVIYMYIVSLTDQKFADTMWQYIMETINAAHLTSSVLCHKFYCHILKHFYVASYPEQNQMCLDNTLAL